MKFCKDCFHFKNDNCYHEKNLKRNLITADLLPIRYPWFLREKNSLFGKVCGKKAKWFMERK